MDAIEYSPSDDTLIFSDQGNNCLTKISRTSGATVWRSADQVRRDDRPARDADYGVKATSMSSPATKILPLAAMGGALRAPTSASMPK